MGDLDKNIYRKEESSPYEKIIVNPVEKDRKEKESFSDLKNATRPQILAALVSYFKTFLSCFKGKSQTFSLDIQQLLAQAAAFRKQLALLSEEDLSHQPDFTQQLTTLWHNLLNDCNSLPLSVEPSSEILQKMKFLISQIQNFPPGNDYSLGYYFEKYAGKDWIPFPFMQLLQQLHREYQASPAISVLNQWISLFDEILAQH